MTTHEGSRGTDRRELLGRGSVYTVATLAQLGALVLVLPVITRLLPQVEFGLVVGGTITTQIMWMLASLGLPAVVTREYFDPAGGPRRSRELVALAAAAAAVLAGLAVASAPLWHPAVGYTHVTGGLVAAVASGGAFAVTNAAMAYLRAQGRAGRFVAVTAVTVGAGQTCGLAAVVLASRPSHAHYLLGLLLGYVVGAVFAVLSVGMAAPRAAHARAALAIGLPAVPHMLGLYVMGAMDRLVLANVLGSDAVARYQVAYFVGTLPVTFVLALNNAWAPMVLGTPLPNRWERLRATSRLVAGVAVVVTALVVLAAPLALIVAAPAEYDRPALVPLVAILAGVTVPFVAYLAHSHVLFSTGRTGRLLVAAPLAALSAYVANVVLVPRAGLVGSAVAAVIGNVVLAAGVAHRARVLARVHGVLTELVLPTIGLTAVVAAISVARSHETLAVSAAAVGLVAAGALTGLGRRGTGPRTGSGSPAAPEVLT